MSNINYEALGRAVAAAIEGASEDSQLSREDLKTMTPEQINAARKAGRLDEMLGVGKHKRRPAIDPRMTPEQVQAAVDAAKEARQTNPYT